jgi:CheY-like chemotaxis protein
MPPAASSQPLRVLYVEDNALVREITCELLAVEGRSVVACSTAEEALQEFRQMPFDIVITDVSLPVMSGLELARNILSSAPTALVIVASGYTLNEGLEHLGPNVRAVTKPFSAEQIDELINGMLASR